MESHRRRSCAFLRVDHTASRRHLSITDIFPYFFLCSAEHKKKNWLFVGHPAAGDRAAVIYSLAVSCQRHGHNPHDYLRDVLGRLPAMTTSDDLRSLLPSQWKSPTATTS